MLRSTNTKIATGSYHSEIKSCRSHVNVKTLLIQSTILIEILDEWYFVDDIFGQ